MKYFLIDRLCDDIEVLKNYFDVFIITDGRLISEFEELRRRLDDIKIIRVIRENYDNNLSEKEKNHITETDLDNYYDYDYTVYNTSKSILLKEVNRIVEEESDII